MAHAVLGAGAWGSALACHLAQAGPVELWARRPELIDEISRSRRTEHYLPGIDLPAALHLSQQFEATVAQVQANELIVLATPVAGLAEAMRRLAALKADGMPVAPLVGVAKGLDAASGLLPHQLAESLLPGHPFAVLSGPSFALELARGLPCALVAAATDAELSASVQAAFHHHSMRVYRSDDLRGVELCGALKNVMALAAGIADGLQLGDNARAALVTRGLAEMSRLGVALGAQPATFMGLAGLGDLMLTCTGGLSRNRQVGLALATGRPIDEITRTLGHVAEGVPCCAAALALAAQHEVAMPIATAVQAGRWQRVASALSMAAAGLA